MLMYHIAQVNIAAAYHSECYEFLDEFLQESGEEVILKTVETEKIVQEESQEVITEKLEQLVQSTEENIEQIEKQQLNDDLTQLSESITKIAEEPIEETKPKRKRRNKKSVAVNI